MIVRSGMSVLVMGLTGKQGTYWTEKMAAYGTRIIGGTDPERGGERHLDLPVWGSAEEATRSESVDVAALFVPARETKAAALDAIRAGIRKIVCVAEHVPVHDAMHIIAEARATGAVVLGPGAAGVVTTGDAFVGVMPAFDERVFSPGTIGVIARSRRLGALAAVTLVQAGLGISAFISIGDEPIVGTTTRDALIALDTDPRTQAVAVIGDVGGSLEQEAALYASTMDKPVVAYITGRTEPYGQRHGAHAVAGASSPVANAEALRAAGVQVSETLADVAVQLRSAAGRA
jgi:succinyl-CoA synthetase alpha subunit